MPGEHQAHDVHDLVAGEARKRAQPLADRRAQVGGTRIGQPAIPCIDVDRRSVPLHGAEFDVLGAADDASAGHVEHVHAVGADLADVARLRTARPDDPGVAFS